jgi:hypothetical protein
MRWILVISELTPLAGYYVSHVEHSARELSLFGAVLYGKFKGGWHMAFAACIFPLAFCSRL